MSCSLMVVARRRERSVTTEGFTIGLGGHCLMVVARRRERSAITEKNISIYRSKVTGGDAVGERPTTAPKNSGPATYDCGWHVF